MGKLSSSGLVPVGAMGGEDEPGEQGFAGEAGEVVGVGGRVVGGRGCEVLAGALASGFEGGEFVAVAKLFAGAFAASGEDAGVEGGLDADGEDGDALRLDACETATDEVVVGAVGMMNDHGAGFERGDEAEVTGGDADLAVDRGEFDECGGGVEEKAFGGDDFEEDGGWRSRMSPAAAGVRARGRRGRRGIYPRDGGGR